jgi:hypothetical protein
MMLHGNGYVLSGGGIWSNSLEETMGAKAGGRFKLGLDLRDSVITADHSDCCAGSCLSLGGNGQ